MRSIGQRLAALVRDVVSGIDAGAAIRHGLPVREDHPARRLPSAAARPSHFRIGPALGMACRVGSASRVPRGRRRYS